MAASLQTISTLSGSTEGVVAGEVSSHCCRKYLHRREGGPSLIKDLPEGAHPRRSGGTSRARGTWGCEGTEMWGG